MRDLVVREALRTLAGDAATLFRELVAQGAEIPYDVTGPEEGSPLVQYAPRTDAFVRRHAARLRELDSFGTAAAVLERSGLAAPYLDEAGVAVPPEGSNRGELASVVFLCRLWSDSSDFSVASERVGEAIADIEALGEASEGEFEVFVALRGLQLPVERLDLPGVTLVRSDTIDVPPEARRAEGAPVWTPQFLAAVRVDTSELDEDDSREPGAAERRAVEAFRELVTTLRLFRPGSVSLGPHAWMRVGGERWRRISTGAGRARGGEYRLAEAELPELQDFARALEARPARARVLARAVGRFEAGLERQAVLDALNDHLLCLRFLLEGAGPASLSLEMRVAALCAEPDDREAVKRTVQRAQSLERELWSGEPAETGDSTAADVAGEIEDLTRAILADAAAGHLGSDLRATADEILLADGLASASGESEGQLGGTAEWGVVGADDATEEDGATSAEVAAQDFPTGGRTTIDEAPTSDPARPESEEETVIGARARSAPRGAPERPRLRAVPDESRVTDEERDPRVPRRDISKRVDFLFPRPEPCDWGVAELEYDRRRRAPASA